MKELIRWVSMMFKESSNITSTTSVYQAHGITLTKNTMATQKTPSNTEVAFINE